MKKIMVTGGAGFLGSHLCEKLLAAGGDVLCVDNYFTGAKENIAHLIGNPYFELLRHDITFPLYVEVEQIYNLACPASPVHYQFDPVQTTKTSVHGAINMLGLAKRVKARILQASTSEVYGDPEVHPQTEDYAGRVNFIHIEPYVLADLRQGNVQHPVPAVREWRIQSEPWVFVIDGRGKIAGKFEGIMAADEVESVLAVALDTTASATPVGR